MRWIPGWSSLCIVHPSILSPNFISVTPSMGILFPILKRNEVSTLWSSSFLIFLCFENCILGILSFWANIHSGPCVLSNRWLWASTSVFSRHWHSLTRDSYIRVLSAKYFWHMQLCLRSVIGYGMDPWRQSLHGPSFCLSSKLCLCNSLHVYFAPHSKEGWSIHTLVSWKEPRCPSRDEWI